MNFKTVRLFSLVIALPEGEGKRRVLVFADDFSEAEEAACLKYLEKNLKTTEITGLHRSLERLLARAPREEEILEVFEKVARLLKVNISLAKALRLQLPSIKNKAARYILLKIIKALGLGKGLKEAFSMYDTVFSRSTLALIESAEASNDLSGVFFRIGSTIRKKRDFTKKFKGELIYPKIVLAVSILVAGGFFFRILPKLKEIYDGYEATLPALSLALYNFSQFLNRNFVLMIGLGFLVVFAFMQRNKVLKSERFQALLYEIPRIGQFCWQKDLVGVFEYLVLLLSSGVSFKESIGMVAQMTESCRFRALLEHVKTDVIHGASLTQAFGKVAHHMKNDGDEFVSLVEVGESSGDFEGILEQFVSDRQLVLEAELNNFSQMIKPLMTLVMAGVASLIATSFLYPFFRLTTIVMEKCDF